MELDGGNNVIIGGDFNCPLDPTMDKKGGILIPQQHVINAIENIQNEFSLHNIWRVKNHVASHGAKCLLSFFVDLITG